MNPGLSPGIIFFIINFTNLGVRVALDKRDRVSLQNISSHLNSFYSRGPCLGKNEPWSLVTIGFGWLQVKMGGKVPIDCFYCFFPQLLKVPLTHFSQVTL